MRRHLHPFIARHEPRAPIRAHLKSGIGALVTMTTVGALAGLTGMPLLIAPFGATAVLLFGQPASPLAQPMNVVGGYLAAALVAALFVIALPGLWWAATVATGLAIAVMLMLRVTHPPAGAIPLVAFGSAIHLPTLFAVIAAGTFSMIALAVIHHRLPPTHEYPRRPAEAGTGA